MDFMNAEKYGRPQEEVYLDMGGTIRRSMGLVATQLAAFCSGMSVRNVRIMRAMSFYWKVGRCLNIYCPRPFKKVTNPSSF